MDETFEEYVAQRRPALLRSAWAITGDRHAAEDLVQEALVKVGERWHLIREPRAVDAYVRRALVNGHRTAIRRPQSRHEHVTGHLPDGVVPAETSSQGPGADLWPLVAALPPRQRCAVALRYYEGLTEVETAEVLRCSLGTVKSNTSRGLATLRRLAAHDPERFIA